MTSTKIETGEVRDLDKIGRCIQFLAVATTVLQLKEMCNTIFCHELENAQKNEHTLPTVIGTL